MAFTLRLLSFLILAALAGGASADTPLPFAARDAVRSFAHALAQEHRMNEETVLATLAEAQHLPAVIKAILPPASPASRSWVRYRARYLDRARIEGGLAFWQAHAGALARAEDRFGVPAEVVVAIIGVETVYGRHTGRFQTLSALATLAFDYPPRADLFRAELTELFLLAREQQRDIRSYSGSYAGALGLPQFLPGSIRRHAVDFDGDGVVDLEGNATDAIGSVASFLARHGWEAGQPVALPAHVSDVQRAAAAIEAGILPRFDTEALATMGIRADSPTAPAKPAALIDLPSAEAPTQYWLGYTNFYVITRYNRSSFYAMAVHHLATTLREAHSRSRAGTGRATDS